MLEKQKEIVKPCPTCKLRPRSGKGAYCIECRREYRRDYQNKNREKSNRQARELRARKKAEDPEGYLLKQLSQRQKNAEYQKNYRKENKVTLKFKRNIYRKTNRDKINLAKRERRKNDPEWREKDRIKSNKYYHDNHEKSLVQRQGYRDNKTEEEREEDRRYGKDYYQQIRKGKDRKRWKEEPEFKLGGILRRRVLKALKAQNIDSSESIEDLVGCTNREFIAHLESQFTEGMSWANHGFGNDKWNVDHIIPCASFTLANPEERKLAFHYTNQRPLWQPENFKKNDKMPDGTLGRHRRKRGQ